MVRIKNILLTSALLVSAYTASAQPGRGRMGGAPKPEVIVKMAEEGGNHSQLEQLAYELLDSIGPRLVGSPAMKQAGDWAVAKFKSWGIDASIQNYGEWRGWERGVTHADMIFPRIKSLEATQLAWSPGTKGKTVSADVVLLPELSDSVAYAKWLPTVKGKFVMISQHQVTGRTDENWKEYGTEESIARIKAKQEAETQAWNNRIKKTGFTAKELARQLEDAGALGILTSYWSKAHGSNKIFGANTKKVPTIDITLEDYGLLYRLIEHGTTPKISLRVDSKELGVVPTFNTIAEIKGVEKPDEYVILSAHFDSWDGGTGATDNGTGTITMMEAARLLKKYYPNPKRTILIGLWGSEEQGLNGSRGFVEDNPNIVKGIQAVFNQDNGTGRVVDISGQGFLHSYEYITRWLSNAPDSIRKHVKTNFPGLPGAGGSDFASFVAAGAPAFSLSSISWDYGRLTWHTQKDTYDKIVFDDVKNNAILTAALAYMASEDLNTTSRERIVLPKNEAGARGRAGEWPEKKSPIRKGGLD